MKKSSLLLSFIAMGYVLFGQEAPLLETVVQTGHYEAITSLSFSKDGKYLSSGASDNTAKLWEVRTGREIRTFYGSPFAISDTDISADNKLLLTVNRDSSVWIWELATGKLLKRLQDKEELILNAAFTPDGKSVLTGGKNFNLIRWDLASGSVSWKQEGEPLGCASPSCRIDISISPDGKQVLTGIGNRSVRRWDINTGELLATYKGHKGSCSSCVAGADWSADGKEVVSVAGRDSVRFWNVRSGKQVKSLFSESGYERVSLVPSGDRLVLADRDFVVVVDSRTGKELFRNGTYAEKVDIYALSGDGRWLAMAGADKRIHLVDMNDLKLERTFLGVVNTFEDNLSGTIRTWVKNKNTQAVSPDGKYVVRGKTGNVARLWELSSGRVAREFKGHEGPVIDLSFSPDGKMLLTASADGTARIWDVATGKEMKVLRYHRDILFSCNFSRDGKLAVTSAWDGRVAMWDVESGQLLGRYNPHDNNASVEATLTPEGLYVISGGLDQRLVMTERDTGLPVKEFVGHRSHVVSIDYSPDSRFMLSGSWDGLAKIWDLSTGLQVRRFEGHERQVFDVRYSPDGKKIATGGEDKTIRIWDVATGEQLQVLRGHRGGVTSVTFSSDGKRLVSGSRDGTTRVWDLLSGKELFTHIFTGENDWIVTVPDGHFYATEGARKSVFFVKGLETYDIDRFFEKFYDPALLLNLEKNQGKTPGKDGNRTGLLEQLDKFPPPVLEIMSPKPPYTTDKQKIDFMLRVTNSGGGLSEVRVLHNGKQIVSDQTDLEKVKEGKSIVKLYSLETVPGRNVFTLSAVSSGRLESEQEQIEIFMPGEAPRPNCYVLVVGINKYSNPALDLNYAEADAKAFVDRLKKGGKDLYGAVETKELYNRDATKSNILNAIKELREEVTPNDVFYLYYAGHGTLVEGTFYFVPTDVTRLYDISALQSAAISADLMNEELRQITALKQVVVMDACHSGGSTELLASRGAEEEKALAQLSRAAGIHVLAAAGSEQTAAEFRDLGHGLFTYMLLEAMNGQADGAPQDNKVTVYELKSFLDDKVPEYSEKFKGSPQFPSTFSRGMDFPLVFIRN